jgi:hypothetical protein
MKRGPIRVPQDDPSSPYAKFDDNDKPEEVTLPPGTVIDVGVAKFLEMAGLHWPNQEGGFKLTSFDIRNDRQLRMTLGLVYIAMLEADEDLAKQILGDD